jgi:hypothetical protein
MRQFFNSHVGRCQLCLEAVAALRFGAQSITLQLKSTQAPSKSIQCSGIHNGCFGVLDLVRSSF